MIDDTPFVPLAGGCKCGKVRFRMEVGRIVPHRSGTILRAHRNSAGEQKC